MGCQDGSIGAGGSHLVSPSYDCVSKPRSLVEEPQDRLVPHYQPLQPQLDIDMQGLFHRHNQSSMYLGCGSSGSSHGDGLRRTSDLIHPVSGLESARIQLQPAIVSNRVHGSSGGTHVKSQYHTSIKNGNMARNRDVRFILNRAVSGTRTVHTRKRIFRPES